MTRIPFNTVDVGARWVVVAQLPSAQAALNANSDLQQMRLQDNKEKHTGVVI